MGIGMRLKDFRTGIVSGDVGLRMLWGPEIVRLSVRVPEVAFL